MKLDWGKHGGQRIEEGGATNYVPAHECIWLNLKAAGQPQGRQIQKISCLQKEGAKNDMCEMAHLYGLK